MAGSADAAREAARERSGRFGEQVKADPGSRMLAGEQPDLACGTCGRPVTDSGGQFVDERGLAGCTGGRAHTAHTYEEVDWEQMQPGDRFTMWGEGGQVVRFRPWTFPGGDGRADMDWQNAAGAHNRTTMYPHQKLTRLTSEAHQPASKPRLACGLCGAAVTARWGRFYDHFSNTTCDSGAQHVGSTFDMPYYRDLQPGDRVVMWEKQWIITGNKPNGGNYRTITYLSTEPGDNQEYSSDVWSEPMIRLTSDEMPAKGRRR